MPANKVQPVDSALGRGQVSLHKGVFLIYYVNARGPRIEVRRHSVRKGFIVMANKASEVTVVPCRPPLMMGKPISLCS